MSPQHVFTRRCIVALLAFVWVFSTVLFQMYPQLVCPRRCKVTLVTFVWLFSTVRFWCVLKLPPKMQSHTALFWFISAMCFKMSLQIAYLRRYILCILWVFYLAPKCLAFLHCTSMHFGLAMVKTIFERKNCEKSGQVMEVVKIPDILRLNAGHTALG